MKRIVFILLIAAFFFGCEKEKPIEYSSSLIGEWEWLSTCGGFSGLCSTPKTTKSTGKLVFNQDSMFYEYRNNSLISSYEFSILKTPADNHTFGLLLIDSRHYLYSIIHDTLNFMPEGADFSSSYKRIK